MSKTYTEERSTIKGKKIVGEARKISDPIIIPKSGRHKAQRIILSENAMCRIAKKFKFIK
ncbi:MAG: hypothetical protein Q8N08_09460 [Methanobacteriaceae archaeon]|nr:hypothetical protein [Methanobacteriaceae archaeon]